MTMTLVWLIVLVTAVIVESATFFLVSIWFAFGALAALIASVLGAGTILQMVIFIGVSVLTLIFTRPLVKKLLPNNYVPTNGELDIGRNATVIEKIDPAAGTGRVRLDGINWGARTDDGSVIEEGATVIIKSKGAAFVTVERA